MGTRSTQTPFDGLPGFWNRVNRVVYRFAGPAQLGAGRVEQPYVPQADPACPVCGTPLKGHVIQRNAGSSVPTRLLCP